jgi:hypothetical protein
VRLVEIRTGLRRLEFEAPRVGHRKQKVEEALVEFVCSTPLRPRDIVRVELGVREGVMRELIGRPDLVRTVEIDSETQEYHYRLHAQIVMTARAPR